jgi:predicted DNA-binding transcriptional regulator AlpA
VTRMSYRLDALTFMPRLNSHAKHSLGHKKRLRAGQADIRSKLDDMLERKFCKFVREGLSYERCCDLCGISRQTFYDWLNRGTAEPQTRYGRFERKVRRANAEAVRTLHNDIRKSNPQWLLERRFPAEYGPPKTRTELSGPDGAPIRTESSWSVEIVCHGEIPQYPVVDAMTMRPVNGANGSSG